MGAECLQRKTTAQLESPSSLWVETVVMTERYTREQIQSVWDDFRDFQMTTKAGNQLRLTAELNPAKECDLEAVGIFAEFVEAIRKFAADNPNSCRIRGGTIH
jgi:hypothetical protein